MATPPQATKHFTTAAGDERGDGVTAVEAVVETKTVTVRDTVTVGGAERIVVERKAAEICGTTEVFVAETMADEVCESTREEEDVTAVNDKSVSDSESEAGVDEEESTEALLTAFAYALKKPLAPVVDWRPSEDAGIGVGETVFATSTLEDGPEETAVDVAAQEVVEVTIEREAATVPDRGDVINDWRMADEAPETKYSCPLTDLELEAMEACDLGKEETVAAEKKEYDKQLEERLVLIDEVKLKRQMKVSAGTTKDPSLEDMVKYLGIPEEVLERYWWEWLNETLERSAEAKRTNRDFRSSSEVKDYPMEGEA
ncbi:hypothetical protein PInf_004157 [Phytophthora infestans]|nr:hypothetical protein PInf_004157 [Phytophthora infestans]